MAVHLVKITNQILICNMLQGLSFRKCSSNLIRISEYKNNILHGKRIGVNFKNNEGIYGEVFSHGILHGKIWDYSPQYNKYAFSFWIKGDVITQY